MIRRLLDRLVVGWCRLGGMHFIEPWSWYIQTSDDRLAPEEAGHSGCSACTWCVECGSLLGRGAVDIWS